MTICGDLRPVGSIGSGFSWAPPLRLHCRGRRPPLDDLLFASSHTQAKGFLTVLVLAADDRNRKASQQGITLWYQYATCPSCLPKPYK